MPEWSDVEKAMQFLIERNHFDEDNAGALLQQFGYLKRYLTDSKLEEWALKKMSTEQRWVELFRHFQRQDIPYVEISSITEFALCLPGTSASVERVFSAVTKVWTVDKARLEIPTIRSMLIVKYNMELSCVEFYNMLKENPALLNKISSSKKYDRDEVEASSSTPNDGAIVAAVPSTSIESEEY